MVSPVFGLRPERALRSETAKVSKPEMLTFCPPQILRKLRPKLPESLGLAYFHAPRVTRRVMGRSYGRAAGWEMLRAHGCRLPFALVSDMRACLDNPRVAPQERRRSLRSAPGPA